MEAYFQYQRVRQAVRHSLSEQNGTLEKQPSAPENPSGSDNDIIVVGWDGPNDPLNPRNKSVLQKLCMTWFVSLIGVAVTAASAIDACGVQVYSDYFGVSEVVGALATGRMNYCNCKIDTDVDTNRTVFNRIRVRLSTIRPLLRDIWP